MFSTVICGYGSVFHTERQLLAQYLKWCYNSRQLRTYKRRMLCFATRMRMEVEDSLNGRPLRECGLRMRSHTGPHAPRHDPRHAMVSAGIPVSAMTTDAPGAITLPKHNNCKRRLIVGALIVVLAKRRKPCSILCSMVLGIHSRVRRNSRL